MSDNTLQLASAALSSLLVNLGCRADRAHEVISTALEDGEDPAYLQDQIEQWRAYCLGPRGENIRAVGFFVAAKIEQNQPAPDLTPHRDIAAAWRADLARYRTIREQWTLVNYIERPAEHTPHCNHALQSPQRSGVGVGASVAGRRQQVFDRLFDLYEKQEQWIEEQNALDTAADLLQSNGINVERAPWCWSDSPHAAEIALYETLMEAGYV